MTLPAPDDFQGWFPLGQPGTPTNGSTPFAAPAERLGVVVSGSLSKGLVVKLEREQRVEDLAVGRYVVVHGNSGKRFFCMITDVMLNSVNPGLEADPPDLADAFFREVYTGTAAYATVQVAPQLSIEEDGKPKPVKTIPGHFTSVVNASVEDVNAVFGAESERNFYVGEPLELEHTRVNLDLKRLTERSVGVFGKSGTGKSFLTRVLLAGIIVKRVAVNLIFDMHNDYGWAATDERGTQAKGLGQLFGKGLVSVMTLDPDSSARRNHIPDHVVKMSYQDILPEDLAMLRETMGFTDAMIDAAHVLSKRWGPSWIKRLIDMTADDSEEIEANTSLFAGTLNGLRRRVERFERWGFLTEDRVDDSVEKIISKLVNERLNVVLEFGRYGSSLEAYMLVANYITRRIHTQYVELVERALGDAAMEPMHLVITIEEAHKFLDPKIASQTIFGEIARELRKYKVTLLVVDQRPSGIDEEVMSQIGTRVTALLDNERDIAAVLTGMSGAQALRAVLARLDTKQQAIIMGHAVPMPVVVKTRTYDEAFYEALSYESRTGQPASLPPGAAPDHSGTPAATLRSAPRGGERRIR